MNNNKFYDNFEQLFERLCNNFELTTNVNGGSSADLMPSIKENCYFDALRSILEEEKRKFDIFTAEICRSTIALQRSKDEKNLEFSAVEKTLAECRAFCAENDGEKDGMDSEAENEAQIRAKMKECLREYEQAGKLIDQNINFCMHRAHQVLAEHAQLRPVNAADLLHFDAVLQHASDARKEELKDAVCSQLLLLKAHGGQKKKRKNFSPDIIRILNDYFMSHIDQPYPDDSVKMALAEKCGITLAQVSNWFGNKRIRFRKRQLKKVSTERKKTRKN